MPAERFLVTGAHGDIGEAMGRILAEAYPAFERHGADCADSWPGADVFGTMHSLPRADEPNYHAALEALVERLDPCVVIPGSEPELAALADRRELCDRVLMLCPSVVTLFMDKLKGASWLAEQGLPTPATSPLERACASDLPLVVKRRRGSGGRGLQIVRDAAHLDHLKRTLGSDWIGQAYLGSEETEYTCALFVANGCIRHLQMHRKLDGSTTKSFTVASESSISELLDALGRKLRFEGSLNVQLRLTPEGPFIFEINPRFSSTVMMRHRIGFRDLVWSIETRQSGSPSRYLSPPPGTQVFRMAREVVAPCPAVPNQEASRDP